MRTMGYQEGTAAGISQEALDKFKGLYKQKFNEEILDYQALWFCGFIVDGTASLSQSEHLYRHQKQPSKVTTGKVWHGWVRNSVDVLNPLNSRGIINYTKQYHPLQSLYFNCEVVTGDILPDNSLDILDIGCAKVYKNAQSREIKELEKPKKLQEVDLEDYEE
jgi:hypothetical protein